MVRLIGAYRAHIDARIYAERLARLGIDAGLLRRALDSERLDDVPATTPLVRAVLAEERVAHFRHRAGLAARERREALRLENRERSIVDIAQDLGISRQAVSKAISGKGKF
ncbi:MULTISPECIES: hypothetical protein [unclassified Microbacterium]|uniref:hypothetical protein n=1 Tax=unclassified Microbacterium TaxID=2609290 RepID=UPI0038685559